MSMDKDINQEESSSHIDAGSDSSSSNNDVPMGRSFTMAHALSMVRKRNEQEQQAKQEEERLLEQERKERAREKARRRRQNQKLAKAKRKEEEEDAKSKSNPENRDEIIPDNTTAPQITKDDAIHHVNETINESVSDREGKGCDGEVGMSILAETTSKTAGLGSGSKGSIKRANPFIPRALILKKKQTK